MPTILIVDDESDTVQMLMQGLAIFGFECTPAYGGLQAIREVEQHRPDAVLLDLMLPDIDGYEVARRLRALPGAQSLPIVMISATPDAAAEQLSQEAGASHFFRKPVPLRTVAALLKEVTASR
jgi:CheY-like chemotaxis protein